MRTKGVIIFLAVVVAAAAVTAAVWFVMSLSPPAAHAGSAPVVFEVKAGDGFRAVADGLSAEHLIRSPLAFELFAFAEGRAGALRPGLYRLDPSMSVPQVLAAISGGAAGEATVTIPEGSNVFDIDRILSKALVIRPGSLTALTSTANLEGRLFPDTYQFYTNSDPADIVKEMEDNFGIKAVPLLAGASQSATSTLIVASMLEKEVREPTDQKIVAGIIFKRLSQKMPLDIDATVCYAKFLADPASAVGGCSLTALDFKLDSPYNTYRYKGLPPAPIANPGTSAIAAATHPQSSPYFYYLTDPGTGKTIFAKTLDEQNQNRVKYLESNP